MLSWRGRHNCCPIGFSTGSHAWPTTVDSAEEMHRDLASEISTLVPAPHTLPLPWADSTSTVPRHHVIGGTTPSMHSRRTERTEEPRTSPCTVACRSYEPCFAAQFRTEQPSTRLCSMSVEHARPPPAPALNERVLLAHALSQPPKFHYDSPRLALASSRPCSTIHQKNSSAASMLGQSR